MACNSNYIVSKLQDFFITRSHGYCTIGDILATVQDRQVVTWPTNRWYEVTYMCYRNAPHLMTLSGLQGHAPILQVLRCFCTVLKQVTFQHCKCRILYDHYLATSYLLLLGIPSPTHSFIPGLKPSFYANPSHRSPSFFLFRIHYINSPDCVLLLLSISVFTF